MVHVLRSFFYIFSIFIYTNSSISFFLKNFMQCNAQWIQSRLQLKHQRCVALQTLPISPELQVSTLVNRSRSRPYHNQRLQSQVLKSTHQELLNRKYTLMYFLFFVSNSSIYEIFFDSLTANLSTYQQHQKHSQISVLLP